MQLRLLYHNHGAAAEDLAGIKGENPNKRPATTPNQTNEPKLNKPMTIDQLDARHEMIHDDERRFSDCKVNWGVVPRPIIWASGGELSEPLNAAVSHGRWKSNAPKP